MFDLDCFQSVPHHMKRNATLLLETTGEDDAQRDISPANTPYAFQTLCVLQYPSFYSNYIHRSLHWLNHTWKRRTLRPSFPLPLHSHDAFFHEQNYPTVKKSLICNPDVDENDNRPRASSHWTRALDTALPRQSNLLRQNNPNYKDAATNLYQNLIRQKYP